MFSLGRPISFLANIKFSGQISHNLRPKVDESWLAQGGLECVVCGGLWHTHLNRTRHTRCHNAWHDSIRGKQQLEDTKTKRKPNIVESPSILESRYVTMISRDILPDSWVAPLAMDSWMGHCPLLENSGKTKSDSKFERIGLTSKLMSWKSNDDMVQVLHLLRRSTHLDRTMEGITECLVSLYRMIPIVMSKINSFFLQDRKELSANGCWKRSWGNNVVEQLGQQFQQFGSNRYAGLIRSSIPYHW